MTLPSSGSLSLYQINAEFGRGYDLNAYRGTPYFVPGTATQFYFPYAPISISDFYNTQSGSPVVPGTTRYTSAGSFGYNVPIFNNITFEFWGAGGSGGPVSGSSGATGGDTYANFPTVGVGATGGAGGGAGYYRRGAGAGGGGGSGFGGSTNLGGAGGAGGFSPYGGAGGGSPYGGAGGAGSGYNANGSPGGAPGGGGGGDYSNDGSRNPNYQAGGGGGGGGYSSISFTPASLNAGTYLVLVVGAGGNNTAGYGADGEIRITIS